MSEDTNITPNLLTSNPRRNPTVVKIKLSKIIINESCLLDEPSVLIKAISYFLSRIELKRLINRLKAETIIIRYAKYVSVSIPNPNSLNSLDISYDGTAA